MREDFLHFIWQFQLYNKKDLITFKGEPLEIVDPGIPNSDAGPDFLNSRIRIGELDWAGHVEIHLKSSDWIRHKHQEDPLYDNVVLHVVLQNDKPVINGNEELNTLEIEKRVFYQYLKNYELLVSRPDSIPCSGFIDPENSILLRSMADRLISKRIEKKSLDFLEILDTQKGDWEESIFRWTCQHFGFKKNKDGFRELADILGWNSIRKINSSQKSLEAALFGIAGFLGKNRGEYPDELLEEFKLLKKKYEFKSRVIDQKSWQFFRLRPSNFPTIRIAQLAAFLLNKNSLLESFLEFDYGSGDWEVFKGMVSPYWQKRVQFEENGKDSLGGNMGRKSRENLSINVIPPILFAYSRYSGLEEYQDKAISIYEAIPPENNKIIKNWKELGFEMENSFDTQAFLELQNSYCNKKMCLNCNLGTHLVREGMEKYGVAD